MIGRAVAAVAVVAAAATVVPGTANAAPSPDAASCTATYQIQNQWPTGFTTKIIVTNGSVARTGWTVAWTFANGQVIINLFNGHDTANGASHSVTNLPFNGSLAPGASVQFGFVATQSGTNSIPTVTCS
jgi:cellulase/cellobiase CelA1